MKNKSFLKPLLVFLAVLCCFPFISAPIALLIGIVFALIFGNPLIDYTRKATHTLLQISVVGLGFGMNAQAALAAGQSGFIYTITGIAVTFITGYIIARVLKVESKTAYLISTGTAICGGSAIAAVSPVIDAKSEQTSVALGVVFILNSAALVLFPFIGHKLGLTQEQFGLWSAIAIHDTSSVVGASSQYGKEALAIATTVKLTRALWIIPVAIASGFVFRSSVKKYKIPYFIFAFFGVMILNSYLPALQSFFSVIYSISRQGLVLTLFLIGLNITLPTLKSVGVKPLLLGVMLWMVITVFSLMIV